MEFSERLLRGRIAETIVSQMLVEAGYKVYRYGYEGVLQDLIYQDMKKDGTEEKKIRTMPDFIVIKDGIASFVEVKFSVEGVPHSGKIKKLNEHWAETMLIYVCPEKPYFFIGNIRELSQNPNKLSVLSEDSVLSVSKEILNKYGQQLIKYLK